jgi:two-component system, LuxR family, sensor kinase FixL
VRAVRDIEARPQRDRQAAVVDLGSKALAGLDLPHVLSLAARLVGDSLRSDFAAVYEYLDREEAFLLRAGAGFEEGDPGSLKIPAGRRSHAGYVLEVGAPVIQADYRAAKAFSIPDSARWRDVRSGLGVPIPGQPRAFGVLSAHSRRLRRFSRDDASFLQSVANIVGWAVERQRAEEAVHDGEARLRGILEKVSATIWTTDRELLVTSSICSLTDGVIPQQDDLIGRTLTELLGTGPQEAAIIQAHQHALAGQVSREDYVWGDRVTHLFIEPLRDAGGAITGTIAVGQDRAEFESALADPQQSLEELRARVARELHDDLGQVLTSAALIGRALEEQTTSKATNEQLAQMRHLIESAMQTTRSIAWSLRPRPLESADLRTAMRELARDLGDRHGLSITVRTSGLRSGLPQEVESALYRIVQEALTNTVKHAQATSVRISITRRAKRVVAVIEDNGRGFDTSKAWKVRAGHMGLRGIRDRARALEAELAIQSSPGHGVQIRLECRLP